MKKSVKILIPLLIIAGTIATIYFIFNNPPQAKREQKRSSKIEVETTTLKKEAFFVRLDSYGIAQAATKSTLTSQVSGKIIYLNPHFQNGGYIKKGDLLVQIEDTDYQADVKIAQSEILLAKQVLVQEEAKAKQAQEDWKKLNLKEKPNSLVLRIPQLESAKAALIAAEANLQKAKLNLQRTKITAPYDGRVIEKSISIAQVISSNTQIGTIFAHDLIEVRLPVKNSELPFMNISESIANEASVTFHSKLTDQTYQGKIARSESSIDTNTKQLYLITEIREKSDQITIGEYLTAKIDGRQLKDAIVIPNETIYQSSYVYIEKDGMLERKEIMILWQDDQNSLIAKGLNEGDNLVMTTLGLVSSGTKVQVLNTAEGAKQ